MWHSSAARSIMRAAAAPASAVRALHASAASSAAASASASAAATCASVAVPAVAAMAASSSAPRCTGRGAGMLRSFAHTAARSSAPLYARAASTAGASSFALLQPRRHFHASSCLKKSCGIIGLPNVGKSTLFNALTDTQLAEASNYPFCTIEPNVALVAVPDPMLNKLAAVAKTNKIISAQMKFTDIAGIIKGASSGAGLGNKFLQNIKETDVVLHVVRCFDDPQVIHVDSQIDPVADMDVIETELLLADLQTVEKRIENLDKAKNKNKGDASKNSTVDKPAFLRSLREALNAGVALADIEWDTEAERAELASMQLLTAKPMAYVCNVDERSTKEHNKYTKAVFAHVAERNAAPPRTLTPSGVKVRVQPRAVLRVCSQLESEVQAFDSDESRKEFLEMNDMEGTSLLPIITTANSLLKNIRYYTVGETEARAWAIEVGTNAQDAAGKIHSDLRTGFVCAEVVKPADYLAAGGDAKVREQGLMKVQGRDYIVQDGDILVFRVQGQKGR